MLAGKNDRPGKNQEDQKPFFGDALAELLRQAGGHGVCTDGQQSAPSVFILPKRHPLAALMQELLPVLFELTGMYVQLSNPEVRCMCITGLLS